MQSAEWGKLMKAATIRVTREVFRSLPLLLTRAAFLEVTGLGRKEFEELLAAGSVTEWRPPGRKADQQGYAKYLKVDAARVGGVEGWLE